MSPLRYNTDVPFYRAADSIGTTSYVPWSSESVPKMDGMGWVSLLGHGSVLAGKLLQH